MGYNRYMTKTKKISITLLIIAIATAGFFIYTARKNPTELVTKYYENRINVLNENAEENLSLDSSFVTTKFIASTQGLERSNEGDPFVCSQTVPKDVSELTITNQGQTKTTATIQVKLTITHQPIMVLLVKDNGWKIDEIQCEDN